VLGRSDAYIGVLIDDLVTRGVDEPYRMLTSRAEHRVVLRHDNADLRLSPLGFEIGLRGAAANAAFLERRARLHDALERAETVRTICGGRTVTVAEALRRPETSPDDVADALPCDPETRERVAIEIKLAGYVRRQEAAIARARRVEDEAIPDNFAFDRVSALSLEAREKFVRFRPRSLGAAGRLPGIAPADVAILSVALRRERAARGDVRAPALV
jgi:tRNA uridine 5-carboxymethylaminomethyl modification enzyme